MSPVSVDDDDLSKLLETSGAAATTTASRISSSGHEESLSGMRYLADCDDAIAVKRGTGSTAESTTGDDTDTTPGAHRIFQPKQQHPPHSAIVSPTSQWQQLEHEVLAKQQGRNRSNTTKVIMRNKRATNTHATSPKERTSLTSDKDFSIDESTKKENAGNIPIELQRLENAIEKKIRLNKSASRRTPAGLLQSDIEAKRFAQSRPFTLSEEISRLDARVAARNSKIRLASKRNVAAAETESIETPITSNVGRKPDTTILSTKPLLQREASSSSISIVKLDADKDDLIQNSGMYSGLDGGMASYGLLPNRITNDDLEFGVYDTDAANGKASNGLAVAFAVQEEGDDTYIPSAVEFDPDAKIPTYKNRRFRLYACLAIIVVIVGTITASVGISLAQEPINTDIVVPDEALPYRATLGIRESIEQIVGVEKLDDTNSPYRKALDWIQDVDPLAPTPDSLNFVQRYLMAYFFFATSIKRPWSSGCNPPENGESDNCMYKRLTSLEPITYTEVPWNRWLSKKGECFWAGVYCDDDGQLRALEFSGINMTGTFPEGIVGLSFLQSLSMSFSELEGPLPEVLADMKHLVNVELQGNLFTGTIPSKWYKSRSIQRINLSVNQISGSISPEMSQVEDMKGIFIYENSFTGSLPTEIGIMRSLSFFRINRNFFQGSIPSEIGNLGLLYDFWIQRNTFSGPIPAEFGLLRDLTDFRAQGNLLSGNIPEEFYEMPSIRRVDIFENRFNGTLSSSISKLSLLDQLRINDNEFTGVLPTEMGDMTTLALFVASGNEFVGVVPEELCNLRLQDFGTYFIELQTDCSVPKNGTPEILCPQNCCTHCCDANGTVCIPNL